MKYYKVLTKDMRSPVNGRTKWAIGDITKLRCRLELNYSVRLRLCRNGLHLYTSLDNISIGEFGPRVFEAEPIGKVVRSEDKVCCRAVRLLKELDPAEVTDSHWAYNYCKRVKDAPKVRKNITDSSWAYRYCRDIKDRPSVRKRITNDYWACEYCKNIKDIQSVFKNITESDRAYWYCRNIKDRPSVRKYITDSDWAYCYCEYVKDRPSVRKYIKE